MRFLVLILILSAACSKKPGVSNSDLEPLKKNVKETYAQIAFATYEDSLITAKVLQASIEKFLSNPTEEGLDLCRKAWLAAREPYGLTEAFRFSNGPIDNKDGVEGAINAWPLDESYIDYVRGNANAGIINNPKDFPKISKELILTLNEQGGETNISTGFHAIEFLLWGQDQEDTSLKTAGNRPHTDYLTATPNAERRGQYLKVTADLLVDHLESVLNEWHTETPGNYRDKFLAANSDISLKEILNGLFNFSKGELAGERMFVALNNKDQEDEHSCFSDNTHRDIIQNFNGIRNLAVGEYTRIDGSKISGPGIIDLIKTVNPEKAGQLSAILHEIEQSMESFPVPFDHALKEEVLGRGKLSEMVNKLTSLGDIFAQSIKILNLDKNSP